MTGHTVEKIGGTSISQTDVVLENILIGTRKEDALYNRVFVLSAYAGITDRLLENKKTGEAGVYGLFRADEAKSWREAISEVGAEMRRINADIFEDQSDCKTADQFVRERIEGIRTCLEDLHRLCSFGHFKLEKHLITVREMLSALGEAHSAFNTALLLRKKGVNAVFIDLTGWRDKEYCALDDRIRAAFESIDLTSSLPIVTGYARCNEGLVSTYDRGYTEITFSRIAVLTNAKEAIIHKEYHLSSADPKIVSEGRVLPIGKTNYDVADQLSNLGMEAIHPRAAKGLRQSEIPLRVRNTFERDHEGTVIRGDYCSLEPCVEIVAGRRDLYAVEFFDQDMVGATGYEETILALLRGAGLRCVAQDFNANTLTCYLSAGRGNQVKHLRDALCERYPNAKVTIHDVAIVSAIGSDTGAPGILCEALGALNDAGIEVLAIHQTMRLADMQFIIREQDYEKSICVLHRALVEEEHDCSRVALAA